MAVEEFKFKIRVLVDIPEEYDKDDLIDSMIDALENNARGWFWGTGDILHTVEVRLIENDY